MSPSNESRSAAADPEGVPLLFERHDGVALITLNRPHARNAISPELACRLADAFVEVAEDPSLRVVVLTGAGDVAFCSGGDLGLTLPLLTGARTPEDDWDRRLLLEPAVLDRSTLRGFPLDKPVIAAINGACLAGGMEMALATDIRISAEHAVFGLPEVTRALIPFAGSMVRLPRQIPYCRAMEMLLVGEALTAAEAQRIGLINRVCAAGEVLPRAMELARKIAANGPVSVQQIKRTVLASSGVPLAEGFALENESRKTVFATRDAQEGPRAFMQKRPPVYEGR